MAFESWKPEVIAAQVQFQLEKILHYGQVGVINRNYEGDVQYAKSVRIVGVGDPTVFDVVNDVDMPNPENIADTELEMTIDYHKGFNYKVNRIDQAQTKIDIMSILNRKSSYKVRDAIDQAIASCYTDANANNMIGSDADPVVPNLTQGNAENIYNLIEDCGVALSENSVPPDDRWMIVPPRFGGLIRKDLKLATGMAGSQAVQSAVLNGAITRIGNFTILESNNVPYTTDPVTGARSKYKIMFGTPDAITFASQIDSIRVMDMERQFAKKIDGEFAFGRKVVRPECLGVMTCNFS